MNPQVFYCFEDDDLHKVGRYMQEIEVRRMLILDRDNRLVGVVSIGDIAKASGEQAFAGETLGHIAEVA
jgi:CBS domain-containing protein